jgi:hypothetical protein
MRTKPEQLDVNPTRAAFRQDRGKPVKSHPIPTLKLLLALPVLMLLFSCSGVYLPAIDTTAPEIISVYTNPSTVIAGQQFSLIVQTYDYESYVTVTYDMNNDGFFSGSNLGVFPSAGSKTIAVRAESAGGVTVSFYTLAVESSVLDLFLTFTAVTDTQNGDFQINYTIQNYGNVPILLTGNSYVIYNSNYNPIASDHIGIVSNTLVYNTYLGVNESRSEVLKGYSMYLIPYYFDMSIFYNDGYGNYNTEAYLGGAFVRQ